MLELSDSLQNYTGLTVLTALFCFAAATLVATSRTVGKQPKRMFIICFIGLIFIVAADWFNNIFNGTHPEYRFLHVTLTTVIFCIAPCISVLIAHAIIPSKNIRWVAAVLIAHAVFEIGNVFFGYVFWVDESNSYHRGPLYGVYTAMYAFSVIYLVVESARASRLYQSASVAPMVATVICLASGVGGQIINSNVRASWMAVSMAVVLYYLIYSDVVLRNDALTHLLNRRSYGEMVRNPPLPCTVVLFDIDDFKIANDTYGHSYGDTCLVEIARQIRRFFGGSGRCFRTGGDEFVVISTAGPEQVKVMHDEFQKAMSKVREADPGMPGVSVGYAVAEKGCTNIADVINAADASMYGTKRATKHTALLQ